MVTRARLLAGLWLVVFPHSGALASEQICPYTPPQDWSPRAMVEAKARELGFAEFFVQPEGGCWCIFTQRDGGRWHVLMHPKTLEIVRQGGT